MANKLNVISYIANIGAGKTTMLQTLAAKGETVIEEDLEFWKKTNMLSKFYQDKKKYSYPFQHMVLLSNFLNMQECVKKHKAGETVYLERSIIDARYVFVEVLHDDGDMEDDFYKLYCWQYDEIINKYLKIILPSKFIYLKTTPEVCLERIQKRGRPEEAGIPLDYLKKLHAKYELLVQRLIKEGFQVEIRDN
jgi:deoxyadenosine/deoxycytidine kinase